MLGPALLASLFGGGLGLGILINNTFDPWGLPLITGCLLGLLTLSVFFWLY